MGKEKENKENRIDYKKSISGEGVERIIITTEKVKVFVQPIESNKIRIWLHGKSSAKVTLESEKREKELVIMIKEDNVEDAQLKVAIPTRHQDYEGTSENYQCTRS